MGRISGMRYGPRVCLFLQPRPLQQLCISSQGGVPLPAGHGWRVSGAPPGRVSWTRLGGRVLGARLRGGCVLGARGASWGRVWGDASVTRLGGARLWGASWGRVLGRISGMRYGPRVCVFLQPRPLQQLCISSQGRVPLPAGHGWRVSGAPPGRVSWGASRGRVLGARLGGRVCDASSGARLWGASWGRVLGARLGGRVCDASAGARLWDASWGRALGTRLRGGASWGRVLGARLVDACLGGPVLGGASGGTRL